MSYTFRIIVLPLLSILGVTTSIFVIAFGGEAVEQTSHGLEYAKLESSKIIAGAGIVEARSRNIKIASFFPGIVDTIYVTVGQHVSKGSPLFKMETRHLEAERELRIASLDVAISELEKAASELELIKPLFFNKNKVVPREAYLQKQNAHLIAKMKTKEAVKQLKIVDVNIERATVTSPIDGEILQANIRTGEYVSELAGRETPIVVGDTSILNIRADFDENDAIRLKPTAFARAFLKGDSTKTVDLHFEAIEPLVIPKQSLTGSSIERIDTRVLQVIYSFDPKLLPLYVGQQVDVLVEDSSS